MNTKPVNATIEILGKFYPVRCLESELESLKKAADFLNKKMSEVKDSGKAINLERIAIMAALNISHQFIELSEQKTSLVDKINQRINQLQNKLDGAVNRAVQTELIYTIE